MGAILCEGEGSVATQLFICFLELLKCIEIMKSAIEMYYRVLLPFPSRRMSEVFPSNANNFSTCSTEVGGNVCQLDQKSITNSHENDTRGQAC